MNGKVRGDPKNATVKIYHFTSDWYHFYLFLICIDFTAKYKIIKLYQARPLLHCQCNIHVHACWSSASPCRVAATNMSAGLVLVPQTPLLFKQAYWLSAAARWMLVGPLPLN